MPSIIYGQKRVAMQDALDALKVAIADGDEQAIESAMQDAKTKGVDLYTQAMFEKIDVLEAYADEIEKLVTPNAGSYKFLYQDHTKE